MLTIDESLSIREALQRYYAAHGLPSDGGVNSAFFIIRLGRLGIPVPNPGIRKRTVLYHDIHHLLTGYNTVFSQGEMIIAGYEIGVGCGSFVFAWLVNLWMFALGMIVTPREMFAAFLRGRRCISLYRHSDDADRLLSMTVAELKRCLRLDQAVPPATAADRARFAMWGAIAWTVLLGCAAVAFGLPAAVAAMVVRLATT